MRVWVRGEGGFPLKLTVSSDKWIPGAGFPVKYCPDWLILAVSYYSVYLEDNKFYDKNIS